MRDTVTLVSAACVTIIGSGRYLQGLLSFICFSPYGEVNKICTNNNYTI
jgi:hypothetical protein